jgi:hypothetical protein
MSAAEHDITSTALPVPTPVSGAGSADLVTDSQDPEELRALLARARERLSFYESFDRIIGENLRRMGEMMAETVALREQAAHAAREREAIDKTVRQERERHRAMLQEALAEVRNAQPVIDAMVARLQGAISAISTADEAPDADMAMPSENADVEPEADVSPDPEPQVDPVSTAEESEEASTAAESPAEEAATPAPEEDLPQPAEAPEAAAPVNLEVLAHGVASATIAIALQSMLRGVDAVTRVDAREFADGELRLHVACSGSIPDDILTGWLARNGGTLVSRNDSVIELSFA